MNNQFLFWLAFVAPCPWLKKIISYWIAQTFFNLVRNILCIWRNYGMLILLVIIIGLPFAIIFNFHLFKSFFLSLFIWSYFTKKCWLFPPLYFRSFSLCRAFFLVIFRSCSYGGWLIQLGGLARLGEISPSLWNSYKNIMCSYEK